MATVQQTLSGIPPAALSKASATLAEAFGRTLLISTVHRGPRQDDTSEATEQDLAALAAALPPERLSRDEAIRDAASPEPAMLAAIRQAEGAAPRLPAVLLARSDEEAQTLLAEASAAGFEPGAVPPRREIGLGGAAAGAQADGGGVRIGSATGWDELAVEAEAHGLGVPAQALSGRYAAPMQAATAGLFGEAEVAWFRGEPMAARLPLPPASVSATDRAWFVPGDAADDLLARLCALYEPLYAETVAPIEAAMLHAAGLLAGAPKNRAILRLVLRGPRAVRAVAMRGADRAVRLAGGALCTRGGLPGEAETLAVLAGGGAARLDLPHAPPSPPPAAVTRTRTRWVRGRTIRDAQVWYPRDLSRSVEQASEVLAGPAPGADRAASRGVVAADEDGWEALRAALADALP